MATRFLQGLYYNITIRAGSSRPQPGQPRFAEHYRRIYILVVCIYLAFTIYEADWELRRAGDFYTILGVPPDAGVRDIKRRYRQLSAIMHPDKAGGGPGGATGFDVNVYILVQTAHETLTDDVKRFAYDRFGPEIVWWKECTVIRDFVTKGAMAVAMYYAVGAAALYVFPRLGYFNQGIYWRWVAFSALLWFEIQTITSPDHPWFLDRLVNPVLMYLINPILAFWAPRAVHPPFLPFQAIVIARKLSITLSIALNQVLPFLTADTRGGRVQIKKQGTDEARARQSLDELDKALLMVREEATRIVRTEVAPFAGDRRLMDMLKEKVKRWLVDNTVRNDPMTRAAINQRISRRRQDAPAGAQGNGVRIRPKHVANGDA